MLFCFYYKKKPCKKSGKSMGTITRTTTRPETSALSRLIVSSSSVYAYTYARRLLRRHKLQRRVSNFQHKVKVPYSTHTILTPISYSACTTSLSYTLLSVNLLH